MFEDTIKSVKAWLYDRITSPLSGALVGSWILWNHRLFFVLFSSMPVSAKFNYIDSRLYKPWQPEWSSIDGGTFFEIVFHWQWAHWFYGPLLTAVAYIFLYPYPAEFVLGFSARHQEKARETKKKAEGRRLLELEESQIILRKADELKRNAEEEISDIRKELDRANDTIERERESHATAQIDLRKQIEGFEEKVRRESKFLGKITKAERAILIKAEEQLEEILIQKNFRLFYGSGGLQDPKRSKVMTFGPNGAILEGMNDNEKKWKFNAGRLEFLNYKGEVHSSFYYKGNGVFNHSGDENLPSSNAQTMIYDDDENAKLSNRSE